MKFRECTLKGFTSVWLCVFFLLSAASTVAAADIVGTQGEDVPLPVAAHFTKRKLENGLTYYISRNTEPEKRARLLLVVRAGTALEEDDQRGAAHFVEHMAFNGTEHFPGKGIDRFMEEVGMGTCECYSATTSMDATLFSFYLPTDDAKTIDKGLLVLGDIAGGIVFATEELEKERGVLVEEWREGKGRNRENGNKIQQALYAGSRYAERLTSNEESPAKNLSREAMLAFYRRWYRPDLMAAIVVGDFDAQEVDALIRARLSHLKVPENAPAHPEIRIPERTGSERVVVTNPDTYTFALGLTHMWPEAEDRTVADYRRRIARDIFVALLNERLALRLYEPAPPYLGAGASTGRSLGELFFFNLSTTAAEGRLSEALDALTYEGGRVLQDGFAETEIDRMKTTLLKQLVDAEAGGFKMETSDSANELSRNFLSGEPVPGFQNETRLRKEILSRITRAEINAFGSDLLAGKHWVIIASGPEGKEAQVPGKDAITTKLGALGSLAVQRYVETAPEGNLLPADPVPGKVVATRKIERFGAVEWKLSNGATVVLKPTAFEKAEILFSAYSFGGHSLASDADYWTAAAAVPLVVSGGIGRFDAVALGRKLTGKSARVSPFIAELEEGLSGAATPEDLETMLALGYLYFTAPRRDEALFAVIRDRWRLSVSVAERQPEKAFTDAMTEILFNNHPRRVSPRAETVAGLDLDKAIAFYRDRFADAANFTFFFVGNVAPERLQPLVERYIGSLPTTRRQESWRDVGVALPRGVIKREIRTGTGEKASVLLVFTGDFEWREQKSLELSLTADVLNAMLTESLREEMGGTYGVSVSSSTQRYPRQTYSLTISFNCSPDKVQALTAAVFARIGELQQGKALGRYLDPIVKKKLKAHEQRLKENAFWLWLLSYTYRNEIPAAEYGFTDELIARVNAAGIMEAARRNFDMGNYVQVVHYSGD